jgi:hypothetical protein
MGELEGAHLEKVRQIIRRGKTEWHIWIEKLESAQVRQGG